LVDYLPIYSYGEKRPQIHASAYISPEAVVIGDVNIDEGSSVWPFAVLRGDTNSIVVGKNTSIQENSVVHTAPRFPVTIGDYVTVGHGVTIHGCIVGSHVIIGINSCVLNGANIGENSIVAAGAVVTEGTVVPPFTLAAGVPAKPIKKLDQEAALRISETADSYIHLGKKYRQSGVLREI